MEQQRRSQVALLVALLFCLFTVSLPPPAHADSDDTGTEYSPNRSQDIPSQGSIRERIKALEENESLEESARNRLLSIYRSIDERLATAEAHRANSNRYRQAIESAPAQTQRLQERLKQAREQQRNADELIQENESQRDLKQQFNRQRAEHSALQNRQRNLEDQLRAQQSRPLAAREELAAAKLRHEEIELQLEAARTDTNSNERLQEARLILLKAQEYELSAHIDMLEQELISHEARVALIGAQRDLVAFQVQQHADALRQLQELANLQTRAEAAQAAESAARAKREAWGAHSVLMDVAQLNANLSEQLSDLVARIERSSTEQDRISTQLEHITKGYRSTKQQLDIAGLNDTLGAALRRERRALPDVNQHHQMARQHQQTMTDARLAQFQLEQRQRELEAAPRQIQRIMDERVDPDLPAAERAQIEHELNRLLQDRDSLMSELTRNYTRYIEMLTELHRNHEQLVSQTERYATLLDESLFWIASSNPVGFAWLQDLALSAAWLLDSGQWRNTLNAAQKTLGERPVVAALGLLLFILLLRVRRDIRRRLEIIARRVGKPHSDRFALTLNVVLVTPLLALPWPLVIYLAGWLLGQAPDTPPFAGAVGHALQATTIVAFVVDLFRQLCRPNGLAQAHFHWTEQSRQVLRHNLSWLLAASLPITFIITLTEWQPDEQHRDALGRLAFMFGSIAISLFAARILHPERGALALLRKEAQLQGGWWWLRFIGYPVIIALPLVLGAMALYGYYYTALQLLSRLFTTAWLLIGVGIIFNLVVRWLKLMEKRLSLARAKTRREAALAEREAAKDSDQLPGEVWQEPEEPELDLETIDEQNRGLLNLAVGIAIVSGLWLIWTDLLPALNIFQEVVLWEQSTADGEGKLPLTLVDVILALTVGAFTLMAARNIPGILEISILPRLSIDAGTRYAITAIARYIIVTAGLIAVVNMLGISWSKAQWLVAALGLGLGFGLQEIFANFVSGLIILFERPVRVGDTVTVGELSGTVTRIRIRATTITDWDRREIIIPNKTFITERLVNWTLSDPITRVLIPISVSYDTDPEHARELILQVARDNPRVLEDPEPSVYLTGLGDNALSFELRAFVQEMADRLPLAHELHLGVVRTLREHGIEIPYPQRDLHIRTIDGKPPLAGTPATTLASGASLARSPFSEQQQQP
ncbi:hypothetical protein CAI21_16840 [Alkalilimnicola ehrlichii]|uniref:MscS Mechanosensitive ion channel n=1 Tax=Alkalilimnicola ehrlichii TaxID=351052 RepID=A0A3E0WKD9_9GAMM|nr:mechanosensitive ion channel domain-containing protein [Alkalilimnicola ehrlichii]RFA26359.1 hypothetical protein CAI21_16840 [Alkalilimnicola ehrlichii]RFA33424.1 hypothetical protein CAL65_17325 [Alkalilimnicola ehrlichii]